MANNPPITDKSFDYITPNLSINDLVKILARDKAFSDRINPPKENEYDGELIYRVIGNKTPLLQTNTALPTIKTFLDINHAVADPFRDTDVDKDRIRANGTIDRDMIEKRNVVYLKNDVYAHILFLTDKEEEAENLACFLIRISHKGESQPKLDKGSKIKFTFGDPFSMRDPKIITEKEADQNRPSETKEEKPSNK